MNIDGIPDWTPVLVGVGQVAEKVDDANYAAMSAVDLAAAAAKRALADAGVEPFNIDTIAAVRQFEISMPGAKAPLGRSNNFPRSVAQRLEAAPLRAVLEVAGGQAPQHLVNEFAAEVSQGSSQVVLLVGAEAISTIRALAHGEDKPDFSEHIDGDLEDRGLGLSGLVSLYAARHGLVDAPTQYALIENARRARLEMSRADYARSMGELLAPFTDVAAENPYSAAPVRRDARELVAPTDRNRVIADPYTRFVVSRDQVNQGAAVLLTSLGSARRLGIPQEKWVYLHGHADLREKDFLDRVDLSSSPAAWQAVEHALDVAGITLDQVSTFDLYSCFPIAVLNVCDGVGITSDDPRGLTVSGGLPFFGGPGNNYSMHAIADTVARARAAPGTYGLVGANGGILSKYSVGIYSTLPTAWQPDDSARLQHEIDEQKPVSHAMRVDGWATLETFTVVTDRDGHGRGIAVGRLLETGQRFFANTVSDDHEMLQILASDQPVGTRIYARSYGIGNRFAASPEALGRLMPARVMRLREHYDHVLVRRDRHILEVTINRPESRNSLHPPANDELDQIFDAYLADSDLWVAILTGAGSEAFSAGNDLVWMAQGKPMWVPLNGFAGLTSRRDIRKPVIAAVNGFALGGGFEIALACQLIVADAKAQFALPEVKVGLIAGAGGLVRLPRSVPIKLATELILTGRRLDAEGALATGIVNRVVAPGTALEGARALAQEILAGSPTSIRASLQVMNETARIADLDDAVEYSSPALEDLLLSEDMSEGIAAFSEKRSPHWRYR